MLAGSPSIPRENHWTLIRLVAAFSILVNHNHHLFWDMEKPEFWLVANDLRVFLPGLPTLFFASGFLVSLSLGNSANWLDFSLKRILRVYPPLIACVLVSACLILALGHASPSLPFLAWFIGQATVLQVWTPDFLRDYGVGVPNGSLWVIPVIIQFYLICPLLPGITAWIERRLGRIGPLLILLVLAGLREGFLALSDVAGFEALHKLLNVTLLPWLFFFYLGYVVVGYLPVILRLRRFLLPAILAYLLAVSLLRDVLYGEQVYSHVHPLQFVLLAAILANLAYLGRIGSTLLDRAETFLKTNDPTFGIFVYHMVVINIFVEYQLFDDWRLRSVTFYVLTFVLAFLSMRFLERPIRDRRDQIIAGAHALTGRRRGERSEMPVQD